MTPVDISPFARVVARLDRARDGEAESGVIPTGFPSIDRAIGGGVRLGNLVVLGGDSGAGTSSLALAIAVRQRTPALVLTGELPSERVYERALAAYARVTLDAIRLGSVTEEERVRLAAAATALREQTPVVDTLRGHGIDEIAQSLDAAPHCALIIVDGLESLLQRDVARDDALAYALLSLKRLALERMVVVLAISHLPQLDTTRLDRRPTLNDFGAAGAVGGTADLVLGLFREELYDGDVGVTGSTELRILKFRDGAPGYVDLYHDARYLRFEDMLDPMIP